MFKKLVLIALSLVCFANLSAMENKNPALPMDSDGKEIVADENGILQIPNEIILQFIAFALETSANLNEFAKIVGRLPQVNRFFNVFLNENINRFKFIRKDVKNLLFASVEKGSLNLAKLALNNGAKLNEINKKGEYPLTIAKNRERAFPHKVTNSVNGLECLCCSELEVNPFEVQLYKNYKKLVEFLENYKESTEKTSKPLKKTCHICIKEAKSYCSACKEVYYCSRECQAKDYKNHKSDCIKK